MKVSYNVLNKTYAYEQNVQEPEKLNCLLTSLKGDFLTFGLNSNVTKFQGSFFCDSQGFEHYKILDEIQIQNYSANEVVYSGDSYCRTLVKNNSTKQIKDYFIMTPTGDIIYTLENCDTKAFLDFDIHKFHDFDEWGRDYSYEKSNGVIILRFDKKKGDNIEYSVYVGIKSQGGTLEILNEWIEKNYSYSHKRHSSSKRFVYRFASFKSSSKGKLFICSGKTKEGIIESLDALSTHEKNILDYMKTIKQDMFKISNFKRPLSQETHLAYTLAQHSLYSFVCNSIEKDKLNEGLLAGYPWFAQVWNRDELISLKAYMSLGEDEFVKKRLDYYFLMLDSETGLLRRLQSEDSYSSIDGVFWLAKRFEEFVIHVDSKGKLESFYSGKDLKKIYNVFKSTFEKIIENFWDANDELIKVKNGDSWMDTIIVEFPLDIQVQFIGFMSSLSSLASVCGSIEDAQKYLDFEHLYRAKIRDAYFRHGLLFDEPHKDRLTVNVFLAYYVCPDLFHPGDWEIIFDKTLSRLKTSWGGISSLSYKDPDFKNEYSGEDNKSYHNGDSWYFMNHITALCLKRVSEKKYRNIITSIVKSTTNDILKMGTLGFCSEISSAKEQRAEGCFAQCWSSATFVELIDELYSKED